MKVSKSISDFRNLLAHLKNKKSKENSNFPFFKNLINIMNEIQPSFPTELNTCDVFSFLDMIKHNKPFRISPKHWFSFVSTLLRSMLFHVVKLKCGLWHVKSQDYVVTNSNSRLKSHSNLSESQNLNDLTIEQKTIKID